MSKFWHILGTVGMTAAVALIPQMQAAVAGHAIITTVLGAAWAILGNIVPSPTVK